MNVHVLYRACVYVMLVLATLILSIDATDYNRFALLYPLGVALAAIGAFLTVDRHPELGLSRDIANVLALGSILLSLAEYMVNPTSVIVPLGHWLVYLQLVKMYLPKTNEDDWFLFLLSVVQVVVGSFIGQSDHIGGILFLWVVVSLAALGLFYLRRETDRFANDDGSTLMPAPDPRRPYPGLLSPGFLLSGALVAAFTIVLGGFIFLLMPRWGTSNSAPGSPVAPRHLTGFSDQVRLGQMGEILESDNLVMTVELLNEGRTALEIAGEHPLWGGVTLVEYRDGRWTREASTRMTQPAISAMPDSDRFLIRQRVQLESNNNDAMFALRPIVWAIGQRSQEIELNRYDGTLVRRSSRSLDTAEDQGPRRGRGMYEYEVSSLAGDQGLVSPFELEPVASRKIQLLGLSDPLQTALAAYCRPIVEALPERIPLRIARTLESHLRDSGTFGYSLRQTQVDPSLDPVIDFLRNRKEGHCEYFASALALMLRSQGIPARVVNGFKGGDWNPLVQAWLVREKHAHSWVEALIGTETRTVNNKTTNHPVWLILDPTPTGPREQVVAQVGPNPQFRTIFDALRHIWVFNIIGFNGDTQERLIYGPIRWFFNEARRGFLVMRQLVTIFLRRLFVFRSAGDFFSVRGFFASVTAMLFLLGLAFLIRWIAGRFLRRFRADDGIGSGRNPEVAFFLRLVRLLARSGLERAPAETQREFARRASAFLSARRPSTDGVAVVPEQVVDAYYRVRFGQRPLELETIVWLDARLDALESSLQPAT